MFLGSLVETETTEMNQLVRNSCFLANLCLKAQTSPLFGSKLGVIVLEDSECVVIGDPRGKNDSEVSTGIVLITSNTRLLSTLHGEVLGRVSVFCAFYSPKATY